MNMIRVWGGGVYEDDEFYDYCDHKGILVWQDFTFACRPTPDFQGFEENIKLEAIDNIKRLRNHPSLAIWVGNNEMEEGWVYWGFDKVVPGLKTFYLKLFEDILPSCVSEFDGNRPYWPSSPSSGGKFLNPDSADYGDSHYWKVWHDGYPLESYREFDSRFMSEFGFESFPDIKTVKTFCPEDQMVYNSEIMENHQKNSAGNQIPALSGRSHAVRCGTLEKKQE
jgi:beta-mannosidase